MHRRRFLHAATIGSAASPLLANATLAHQPASPVATPVRREPIPLTERVARIEPGTLLDALLTTPVTTSLFPADTLPVEPVSWDNRSDADLEGTVGGVVFNTGYDDLDNFEEVGVGIVHPDAGSAAAAFADTGPATMQTFLALPWFVQVITGSAVSVLRIDYLILTGGAQSDDATFADSGPLTLRAIANMTALLNHLEGVLTGMET